MLQEFLETVGQTGRCLYECYQWQEAGEGVQEIAFVLNRIGQQKRAHPSCQEEAVYKKLLQNGIK